MEVGSVAKSSRAMATAEDDETKETGKKTKLANLIQRKPRALPRNPTPTKQVAYRDEEKPKRKRKRARTTAGGGPDCDIRTSDVFERAEEIESSLPLKFPTILRPMLPSHVGCCFWLGLPKHFCTRHLPKQDTAMILEDERGNEHVARYLPDKTGLSGGWKAFAVNQKLQEGDVVIFQLVKPTKFKVYIVRSTSGIAEVDGALSLLELEPSSGSKGAASEEDDEHQKPPSGSEILKQKSSDDDDMAMEDFRIVENDPAEMDFGLLPEHLRAKYHDLCRSQNSILHKKLLTDLNSTLAVGIVAETVNIADAIRAAKITSSVEDLTAWGKTLSAFEHLGMEVGFLRARLERLIDLAVMSKRTKDVVGRERAAAEEEMIVLEAKVATLKSTIRMLDAEAKILDEDGNRLKAMFHEVANRPW